MSKYPNAFYRVSVKAIIRNEVGRVLLVKEHIDDWVLPGGGLDFGEKADDALKRELHEELAVKEVLSSDLLGTYTLYARSKEAWYMWLLYDVKVESFDASIANDVSEAAFIDINSLEGSDSRSEQRIYEAVMSVLPAPASN